MPGAVTVGGLVINLSANTGQLKTDMAEASATVKTSSQDMVNAWAGVAAESDQATAAGERMVKQLRDEIATFGMSSQELLQHKANLNGVGTEVAALIGRLNNLKDAQAGLSAETAELAAAEANASARIREMVAASLAEVGAMNEATAAAQGYTAAQTAGARVTSSWAESQRLQAQNMAAVAASMKSAQAGTAALSTETQKILARYDPLGTKLRSLQADLAILRKEMGNSVDPAAMKAFQGLEDEIEKTSKLMSKAGVEGFEAMSDGASKSGFATASASRELMVLAHEVVVGNFSRIPGSLMVLTSRVGGLGAMVSELAGGFGIIAAGALLVTGPIGLAAAAAIQGAHDFEAMRIAIGVTNNYAGQTADSIDEMARRIGAAGQITTGTAKQMVTSFVASGQIGGQALEKIALLAGNYAQATGESVDEITPKLIELFSNPKQGADELNKSMHFLTTANIDYIAELENTGQHQQAQLLLAQALSGHLAIQAKEVSGLTQWWRELKGAFSDFWDEAKKHMSSKATPYDAQLQAAQTALDELESTPNVFGGDKELDKKIAAQKAYIASLIAGHKAEQEAAHAASTQASADADRQNAITNEVNQGQLHQIELLKQKRALLDGAGDSSAVQQRRLELDKQIDAIERAMGAEGRQLTQQQLADGEQLALLKLKGQQQNAESARKLGALDQLGYDLRTARIALEENEVKQAFEQRMANVSGLTTAEKQAHLGKLAILREEHDQIERNGAATYDIDDKKIFDDLMKGITDAGDAQIKSLKEQIAKQKEHNAEIGKTKEQIEQARQAQAQATAEDMQREAAAIDALLNQADLQGILVGHDRELYAARLAYLNINIDKEKELAKLRAEGADAEAGAKAAADLAKYLDPTKAKTFGDALKGSFTGATKSLVDLTKALVTYGEQRAANDKAREAAEIKHAKGRSSETEYLNDINQINDRNTKEQLNSYGNMASAAASFFDTSSRGYKALQTASEVMHAAELAMNLASIAPAMAAGAAQFFAQSGWGGFAGVAAMAAVVAGFGVAVSGSSNVNVSAQRQASQGTGTILGDSNAKSDSISKSIELTAANSSTQINYLAGMEASLKSIEANIGSFAAQVVQNGSLSDPKVSGLRTVNYGSGNLGAALSSAGGAMIGYAAGAGLTAFTAAGAIGGPIGMVVGAVIGAIVSKLGIFGGKQTVTDSGFTLDKTSLASVLSGGVNAKSYADITTSGGWFRSDKTSVQTADLSADVNRQFTDIIKSLADSVKQAGGLLGENGDDFTAKLNSFVVDIGNVSLKGLSGDDQQKALEAVFSKLGDQMAQWVVGGLEPFEKVGEGYLQTLTRVATDYAKIDASLQSIGKTFGAVGIESVGAREGLISLMGGIDNLQSKTADFAQNFLTKGQQLAPVAAYVSQQLGAMNLGWVQTREQFASVVAFLDLTTTAGQQTYASLMNLESAFAATHAAIVDTTKSEQEIADERKSLQDKLDTLTLTSAQLHDKERAGIAAVNLELYDRVSALQAEKDAAQAATDAIQAAKDKASGLMGDVDSAFTVLQNVTKDATDALTKRITAEKSLSDAVRQTLSSMTSTTSDLSSRAAAQAQIKAALAIAKAGGPLPDANSLQGALSVVSKDASAQFSTYADYLKDLYGTKNDLSQLSDLTDSALTVDQKQLDSLNAMLDAAKKQVDLLKGIDTTGLSIEQALAGFGTALAAAKANPINAATSAIADQYHQSLGRAPDAAGLAYWQQQAASGVPLETITAGISNSPEATIQGMYQTMLHRPADAAGLNFWLTQLKNGVSMADIGNRIAGSNEAKGIPGFAGGGDFGGGWRLVGENGPELEATGPSRIFNTSQTADLFARLSSPSGNNDVLAAAVNRLNATVEKQNVIIDAQGKTIEQVRKECKRQADFIERMTNGGKSMPTTVVS